jgi:hypothetical protein
MIGKPDPGPCPVDDAPHTTCTSADYERGGPIVIVQLPARDGVVDAGLRVPVDPPGALQPAPAVSSFTTGTYRRAVHGRKGKRP